MNNFGEWLRGLLKRQDAEPETAAPPSPQPHVTPKKPVPPPTNKQTPKPAGGPLLVTVLGLGGDALEGVLDLVERECRRKGTRPIFVTDRHELGAFRRRRLVVEQVVDAEARAQGAPDLAWAVYRRRQYALVAERWRPTATISFGRRPEPACLGVLEGPR